MKGEKDKIEKENKKEYEAPEIEVNKFNNSGDPVEMFAEDVATTNNIENKTNGNTQEFGKVTENIVVDNQNTNKHKKHNNKKDKKPHKRLSKKQKIAILSCSLIVVVLAVVLICLYLYQSSQNNIVLANDTISIEYGEEYIPSVEDFVELTDDVTTDNTYLEYELEYKEVLDADTDEVIETCSYPEVGEYEITIYHSFKFKLCGLTLFTSNVNEEVELVIEDTTAPVFSEDAPTEITTYLNEEITEEKLNETFGVTDYSEFTLSLDENSDVDYSTEGEYTSQIVAVDEYGNQSYLQIVVNVINYTVDVDVTEISLAVGETKQIIASVNGSTDGLTYSSSDKSIVAIDENGTITAVSSGTATVAVTKEEYNISATITVTVTSITTSGSTNSSSNSSTNNNSVSSGETVTSSTSTSSSSSDDSSSSNSNNTTSNKSQNSTTSSSTESSHNCSVDGHSWSDSEVSVGWYNTSDEALNAFKSLIASGDASYSNFILRCCSWCGMYSVTGRN